MTPGALLGWRPGPECLEHWAKVREKIRASPTAIQPQPLAHERAAALEARVRELEAELKSLRRLDGANDWWDPAGR